MSSKKDYRAIELRFDNGEFIRKTKQTTESIAGLKRSMDLTDSAEQFNRSFSSTVKVSDSGIKSMASSFSQGFHSIKNTITDSALYKAVDKFTSYIDDKFKSLYNNTLGQIISGGKARAQNIEQAKFQLGGLGVTWEEIESDLSYAVNETAYGLDQAAKVASQLVASDVKVGDEMKTALRAVSGVAAMTNSSYDEIGHVFTTVAGQGRLMGMQLTQLATRGLNVAAALAKSFNTTEEAVREMVHDGQIDFMTFAKAMDDAYGEHAKEANKTFTGALSNMRAALSRVGELFATPAYNNLRDVFNATTPVINAFKKALIPVGDIMSSIMEKASKLAQYFLKRFNKQTFDKLLSPVTAIADSIDQMLSKVVKKTEKGARSLASSQAAAANEAQKHGIILDGLAKSADNAAEAIDNYTHEEIEAAKDAIAGKYGNGEARRNALEKLGLTYDRVQKLVDDYSGKVEELDKLEEQLSVDTEKTNNTLEDRTTEILKNAGASQKTIDTVKGVIKTGENIFHVISNISTSLTNLSIAIRQAFLQGTPYDQAATDIGNFSDILSDFSDKLVITSDKIPKIRDTFSKFFDIFRKSQRFVLNSRDAIISFSEEVKTFYNRTASDTEKLETDGMPFFTKVALFISNIGRSLRALVNVIKTVASKVKELDSVKHLAENLTFIGSSISDLASTIMSKLEGPINKAISWLLHLDLSTVNAMSTADKIVGVIDKVTTGLAKVTDVIKDTISWIKDPEGAKPKWLESIEGFLERMGIKRNSNVGKKAGTEVGKTFGQSIKDGIAGFDWGSVFEGGTLIGMIGVITLLLTLGHKFVKIADTIKSIPTSLTDTLTSIKTTLDLLTGGMKNIVFGEMIFHVALGIAALALSLKLLAEVPANDLARATVYLVIVLAMVKAILGSLNNGGLINVTKTVGGNVSKSISGNSLVNIQGSPLYGLAALLFGLVAALIVITNMMSRFSAMSPAQLIASLTAVSLILGSLIAVTVALYKMQAPKDAINVAKNTRVVNSAAAIVSAVAGAVLMISNAIKIISAIDPEMLQYSVVSVLLIMMALFAVSGGLLKLQTENSSSQLVAIGGTMMLMSGALLIISAALAIVAKAVPDSSLLTAVSGALLTFLMFFALVLGAFAKSDIQTSPVSLILIASSMVIMASTLLLIAGAMLMLNGVGDIAGAAAVMTGILTALFIILGLLSDMASELGSITTLLLVVASFVLLSSSLLIIASAIRLIGNLENLLESMTALGVLLVVMGGVLGILTAVIDHFSDVKSTDILLISVAMVLMSGAILAIAYGLTMLADIDPATIKESGKIIGMILGVMALLLLVGTVLGSVGGRGLFAFGEALLLMGLGMLAFGAGLMFVGKYLPVIANTLPLLADGIVSFFEILSQNKGALAMTIGVMIIAAVIVGALVLLLAKMGPALTAAAEFVTTMLNGIVEFIKGLKPDAQIAFAGLVTAIVGGLALATPEVIESISQTIVKVLGFIGSITGDICDALVILLINLINSLADAIRENAGPIWAALINLLGALLELILLGLQYLILPLFETIATWIYKGIRWLSNWLWTDVLQPFEDWVLEGVNSICDSIIEAIVGNLRKMLTGVINFSSALLTAGAGILSIFGFDSSTLTAGINNLRTETLDKMDTFFNDVEQGAKDKVHKMTGAVVPALLDFAEGSTGAGGFALARMAKQGLFFSDEEWNDAMGSFQKYVDDAIPKAREGLQQWVEDTNIAIAAQEKLNEKIDESDVHHRRLASSQAMAANEASKFGVELDKVNEKIPESGSGYLEAILGHALDSAGIDMKTGEFADVFTGSLKKNITTGASELDINSMFEQLKLDPESKEGQEFMANLDAIGEDGITAWANGTLDNDWRLSDASIDAGNVMIEKGFQYDVESYKLGQAYDEGLNRGVYSKLDRVSDAGTDVGKALRSATASYLGVHSPSRVAMEIGEFFSLGMAIGIQNKADAVTDSVSSLATDTIDVFSESLQTISDAISSDVEANPTIRPVMDLTNVQSSVGSINSMFAHESGRLAGINSRLARESEAYRFELDQNSRYDNTDVVASIMGLQTEMTDLKDAMMSTQIVMDTGVMVGQLTPGIDKRMGQLSSRKARKN